MYLNTEYCSTDSANEVNTHTQTHKTSSGTENKVNTLGDDHRDSAADRVWKHSGGGHFPANTVVDPNPLTPPVSYPVRVSVSPPNHRLTAAAETVGIPPTVHALKLGTRPSQAANVTRGLI